MPTGAGKSICYQIPATLLPGMTVVISPLISLMRDQVDALNDVGIPAAFINTTQSPDEQDLVFVQALSGRIRLLYVAPERLETERFRTFASRVPISLVAVDEAHCVSQWGQDFRSSYLGIGDFLKALPTRPTVAAFTATATVPIRVASSPFAARSSRTAIFNDSASDSTSLRVAQYTMPDSSG